MIYFLPKYFQPIIYKVIKWHYRKPRKLVKRGIKLTLLPSVFHPNFYLSTDIFLDYILSLDLKKGNALELGCGNGFISLYLAKNTDLDMYSSDINPAAIEGVSMNAALNQVDLNAIQSDLFDAIPDVDFEHIFINPPYYKAAPKAINEHAFFAGSNLEYFTKLFEQLNSKRDKIGSTYFILSENAPISKIFEIANGFDLKEEKVYELQRNQEWFYIYNVTTDFNTIEHIET